MRQRSETADESIAASRVCVVCVVCVDVCVDVRGYAHTGACVCVCVTIVSREVRRSLLLHR